MGGFFLMRKLKKVLSIVIILVLLPYIVTIFFSGEAANAEANSLLDEYCIGVLAKEVSSDYEDEMLKVQAVIVRTTVYQNVNEIVAEDVSKLELDRAWRSRLERAWKETEGQVMMYNDKLALLPFHQLSNGKTRSGQEVLGTEEYPYLQVKDCAKDVGSELQMQTKVIEVAGVSINAKDSSGYVTEVKVGEEICSGDAFRDTYSLASSCFDVQEFDGKTRVISKGVGHGLGMSQYTANEMAKEGKTHIEILQYFFEGTEMKEVAEVLWDMN